jgi:glycerol-3-phosphate dehydrogenase
MKMISAKLGRELGPCETANRRLVGCEIDDVEAFVSQAKIDHAGFGPQTVDWLARHYGTALPRVLELAQPGAEGRAPLDDDGEILAQATYAVREEMAQTLEDVVMRRTGLGTLGFPGEAALGAVAALTGRELGWDDARRESEMASVRRALTLPQ